MKLTNRFARLLKWFGGGPEHSGDLPGTALLLVVIWVLVMVPLPIVRWALGETALRQGIVLAVLTQVLAVVLILQGAWGWRSMLAAAAPVMGLAWGAEALGSSTGFPFGHYDYTPALQPQLLGVPLLIPLAWLMMLPPAWAVARLALPCIPQVRTAKDLLAFSGVSALAFTAWDLFLDPQMVSWGFWRWAQPFGYFGIPWLNFLGWMLVSGGITALLTPWLNWRMLPTRPLVIIYTVTWLLETIGQLFFWGLPGPAVAGCLGMGGMLVWAAVGARQGKQEE